MSKQKVKRKVHRLDATTLSVDGEIYHRHPEELDWTPFYEVRLAPDADQNAKRRVRLDFDKVFLNSRYEVGVRYNWPSDDEGNEIHDWAQVLTSLSIKRIDKQVLHDWRDLQRIKNEILGPEVEAIEIYPAESRLVDTANQYWLWVLPPKAGLDWLGFQQRLVLSCEEFGVRQRPFSDPLIATEAAGNNRKFMNGEISNAALELLKERAARTASD